MHPIARPRSPLRAHPRPLPIALLFLGLLLACAPRQAAAFSLADLFGRHERASVSLGFGRMHAFDDDMDYTYGGMSSWGARLAIPADRSVDALFGASYIHAHGDPYYGIPAFEAGDDAEFTMVPLEFGLRVHSSTSNRARINLGFLFQEIYAREEIFQGEQAGSEEGSDGQWGWGVRVFLGPEWFVADRRYSLGFELAGSSRALDRFRESGSERDRSFSAFEWRAFFSKRI